MKATDFRDFIRLGLGSPRLLEGYTAKLNNTQCVTLAFILRIYNIHSYTCLLLFISSSVPRERCEVSHYAPRHWPARRGGSRVSARLHSRTRVFAYYLPGRPYDSWFRTLWLTLPFFLSVSFNLILWDTDRLEGLLPNADSGVPCPRFGCKLRSLGPKFLACIFVIINLILNFLIFELGFAFLT